MSDRGFAFIVAVNNALYYDECVTYIQKLIVPEGYSVDIICITEAESMAQAYNTAMESNNAKYKIYLHQDVFILSQNFLIDLLNAFQADPKMGLLGVIGGVNLPSNAITWQAWNVGQSFVCSHKGAVSIELLCNNDTSVMQVEAVDGMLIATQYDIRWREDLQLGWDFYDITQSLEFRRRGYKVGIPYQEKPWCIHDCGISKLTGYDIARKTVLAEYKDFFSDPFEPVCNSEMWDMSEKLFLYLKKLLEEKQYETAYQIIAQFPYSEVNHNQLIAAYNLIMVLEREKNELGVEIFLKGINSWEQMSAKYTEVKFLLRRLEQDIFDEDEKKECMRLLMDHNVSIVAMDEIMVHSIVDVDKIFQYFDMFLLSEE